MSVAGGTSVSRHPIISPDRQEDRKFKAAYLVACILLAVCAFFLNWKTGHRGVFLLDQSMIFDGAWRLLQGQIPYRDFLMPFGPVTFYIQSFFFRLFGVNWSATVLSASIINTLATLSAIRIARILSGMRVLALCAGFATAISFQAPFGTLWLEQTAMFFDLISLQAIVESFHASGYHHRFWKLGAGVLMGVAVLSKQNYGLLFVPVVMAAIAARELPDVRRACRSLTLAAIGMAAAIALFVSWVAVFSNMDSFVHCTLVVAGEIGRSRMNLDTLIKGLLFDNVPNYLQIDLVGFISGVIGLCLACFSLFNKDSDFSVWRAMAPCAVIAILLPWFRSFTQATTLNEWKNNFAFVGLAVCLGIGLLVQITKLISIVPAPGFDLHLRLPSAAAVRNCLFLLAGIWGGSFLLYEGRGAWMRSVQEFEPGTVFTRPVAVRGMEGVRWGDPTVIGENIILREADFEGVVSYLSAKKCNFFVMGDSTLLYGLLGVSSPQPMLYFVPSHSFLKNEIQHLDELVVASLQREHVRIIVREKVTFLPEVHEAFTRFPRLMAWLESGFEHIADFGTYEIWEQRPDPV